ncbi:MAG: hypothetical protein R6U19_08150, partial [Bacteroidales bacterium]
LQLQNEKVFPEDISLALPTSPEFLRATLAGNRELYKALNQYNKGEKAKIYIEDLPPNTIFMVKNGHPFKKIRKKRVRILCRSLYNKRYYIFSPGIQVFRATEKLNP